MVKMMKNTYIKKFWSSLHAGVIKVTKRVKQLYEGDNTTEKYIVYEKNIYHELVARYPTFQDSSKN